MAGFDASEVLTPFREDRGNGAILFDGKRFKQADPQWLRPEYWADKARPVHVGGRGGAWFVDASFGPTVLRHYQRGGLVAKFSRDKYWWRGAHQTRSFAEFRLTRALVAKGLPVAAPVMAGYLRTGLSYRAAIMVERIPGARTLAVYLDEAGLESPLWEAAGRLVARFHRAGLDHVDLNANNILFDDAGHGWMIDFDRCTLRIPESRWRERNLARLKRSLLKLRGSRSVADIEQGYARLRAAYHAIWVRGY